MALTRLLACVLRFLLQCILIVALSKKPNDSFLKLIFRTVLQILMKSIISYASLSHPSYYHA